MKRKAAHHRGPHDEISRRLRAIWTADPATRCGFCGQPARRGDPWQADHHPPGNLDGRYRPAHATCNAKAGATYGNRKRNPTSRNW